MNEIMLMGLFCGQGLIMALCLKLLKCITEIMKYLVAKRQKVSSGEYKESVIILQYYRLLGVVGQFCELDVNEPETVVDKATVCITDWELVYQWAKKNGFEGRDGDQLVEFIKSKTFDAQRLAKIADAPLGDLDEVAIVFDDWKTVLTWAAHNGFNKQRPRDTEFLGEELVKFLKERTR